MEVTELLQIIGMVWVLNGGLTQLGVQALGVACFAAYPERSTGEELR